MRPTAYPDRMGEATARTTPEAATASWSARTTNRWLILLTLGLAARAARRAGPGRLLAVLALAGGLGSATVRVDAGPAGLVVRFGPFGWPRRRIPLGRIRRARVARVHPLLWGGWGYRLQPQGTRVIVRGGEALVVDLVPHRSFGVTVDGAAAAAALLNRAVEQSRAGS